MEIESGHHIELEIGMEKEEELSPDENTWIKKKECFKEDCESRPSFNGTPEDQAKEKVGD